LLSGLTGRLSLDTLAATEWVLRAWDFDEAAPDEPEVTLNYKDGRFAGSSGCNRYSGSTLRVKRSSEMSRRERIGSQTSSRAAIAPP
jgi:hypothetical protein